MIKKVFAAPAMFVLLVGILSMTTANAVYAGGHNGGHNGYGHNGYGHG